MIYINLSHNRKISYYNVLLVIHCSEEGVKVATLTLRLPDEMNKRLNDLSLKTGRTKTYYAKEALEQYIEEMEDIYLAEAALEEHRKTGNQTISFEELGAELGLED